jgi:hypothetical protein
MGQQNLNRIYSNVLEDDNHLKVIRLKNLIVKTNRLMIDHQNKQIIQTKLHRINLRFDFDFSKHLNNII